MAVAVQSHFFGVGRLCPFVRAGVGAVATQASVDPGYGPLGLGLLEAGKDPAQALAALVAGDPSSFSRQVAMVDATGKVAAHTGDKCIAEAAHITGDGWSVQANMMTTTGVPEAMAEAFQGSSGTLVERILAALDAAEEAGGDIRGRQSAALLVAPGERGGVVGADRTWDLRVDDNPEPLAELRRLVKIKRAYDVGFLAGDPSEESIDLALAEVEEATGGNLEMAFWAALTLAGTGRLEHARRLLDRCQKADERWMELLRRLPASGHVDPKTAEQLLG